MINIKVYLILVYNIIRFSIVSFLFSSIKVGIFQFISPLTSIKIDNKKSSITIVEKTYMRSGSVVSANSGGK